MDTLFFLASKAFWLLAKAETWLLLLFGWSILALDRARRSKKPSSRGFLAPCAGTALLVVLGCLPLGSLLLRPLEAQFPAKPELETPAGIIILGGGEDARRTQATDLPL